MLSTEQKAKNLFSMSITHLWKSVCNCYHDVYIVRFYTLRGFYMFI